MPIYEYVCQKCGHYLETMQKMSDKPLTSCPECRGKLEKIFSQTSFQLKGSGWYRTDYNGQAKAGKNGEVTEKSDKGEKKEASTCVSTGGECATGKCDI
jgi:putative FmdB family regulatory protein